MKIRRLDLDDRLSVAHEHDGLPPLEADITHTQSFLKPLLHTFGILLALLGAAAGLAFLTHDAAMLQEGLSSKLFWLALAVGLGAQIIDGALGMAYGITATTFLLGIGVPPAAASASVRPAHATSGSVKTTAGIARTSKAAGRPAMTSAATFPSWMAL